MWLLHRGPYSGSREGMLPVWRDPPSALPLAVVLMSLLLDPRNGTRLASMTIGNYSLGAVIDSIPGLDPKVLFGERTDDNVPIGEGKKTLSLQRKRRRNEPESLSRPAFTDFFQAGAEFGKALPRRLPLRPSGIC